MGDAIGSSWSGYPHIYQIGHRYLEHLFSDPVVIQEKLDGSQLSFGVFGGELRARSKGAIIDPYHPPKLFEPACRTIVRIKDQLPDGWTFRAEAFLRPKHNIKNYSRMPSAGLVVFDINTSLEAFLPPEEVEKVCRGLGLEVVPTYFSGFFKGDLKSFIEEALKKESFLGGTTIEGVVVKNYHRFGPDHHALMGKYVSEEFKETHRKEWRVGMSITAMLVGEYKTEARWRKAIQHLRDQGVLTGTPKDIGPIMKAVNAELLRECQEEIKDRLFDHFWKDISRGVTAGLAEFYKQEMLGSQVVESASRHLQPPIGMAPEGCTDDLDSLT